MRVISLSQPWLWSIDSLPEPDAKRIENRTWPPPRAVIGERVALHAAHSWDEAGISFFVKHGIEHPQRRELYDKGKITSVATISGVIDCGAGDVGVEMLCRIPESQHRWLFGPYGWILVDVRRLPNPIPWRGAQGLRNLPFSTALEIETQLGAAP